VEQAAGELVRRAREQGISLTGPDGLLEQLTRTVIETALSQELTEHLGHEKNGTLDPETGNVRNGTRSKTALTEASGQVPLDVPRDRVGTFEPRLLALQVTTSLEIRGSRSVLSGPELPAGLGCRVSVRSRSWLWPTALGGTHVARMVGTTAGCRCRIALHRLRDTVCSSPESPGRSCTTAGPAGDGAGVLRCRRVRS
jgi:hypothetical protein